MKVFLSWSGARSKATAEALANWLRQVIQAVEPWISSEIEKGVRWGPEIADRLEEARVGIICLTPENLTTPWILFEAGALSKTRSAYVCTLLLGLTPATVEQPLAQFQHTQFTKEEIRRLVHTINKAVATLQERTIPEKDLDEVFEVFWPRLETRLREIGDQAPPDGTPRRPEREILEEILQTVRAQERHQRVKDAHERSLLTAWTSPSAGVSAAKTGTIGRLVQQRLNLGSDEDPTSILVRLLLAKEASQAKEASEGDTSADGISPS